MRPDLNMSGICAHCILHAVVGSAVIYSTSDGGSTWTFLVQLFPSGISQVEAFGSAVSISKDSIAIGAPLDNSVDIDGGTSTAALCLYSL